MKPPGLAFGLRGDAITLGVTRSSTAEDAIWRAVEEAQCENMTPERFIREVRQAWEHYRTEQMKHEDEELSRKA